MIRRFVVHGLVQGVGYRWFVREQATRLGIAGSVRNLRDGSVAVQASGNEAQLGQLAGLLASGPPTANVTKVDIIENADELESVSGFHITR